MYYEHWTDKQKHFYENKLTNLINKIWSWGHVEVQNNIYQIIYGNKTNKTIRHVLRTQSNIYEEFFFCENK